MSTQAMALSELEKEVNDFQVQLVSKKRTKNGYKKVYRPVMASSKPVPSAQPAPQTYIRKESEIVEVPAETQNESVYYAPQASYGKSRGFFRKLNLIPAATFSAFDGADTNIIVPQGMGKAINVGFSGTLSSDLNILGSEYAFLEFGASYLTFGSDTGQNYVGTTVYDQIKLSYIGVNVNGKYFLSGASNSSFFVKGGATPMFYMGQNYNNLGSIYMNALRFGEISTFDLALDFGVGYSYKMSQDLSIVADATFYQGLMAIMSKYNVYHAGITTGIGIAYSL